MTLGVWIIIIFVAVIMLMTVLVMSTHLKEDKVWRWMFSFLFTLVLMSVFGGAYFAGKQDWWWMAILFAVVSFLAIYSVIIPD